MIALTGVLLGLSFPPFPFPALAWFALVPLLLVWSERSSARAGFIDAYVAFLITFAVAFQWPLFHALPATAWLSLPPLLILPMWMAVPFGLSIVVKNRIGRGPAMCALVPFFLLMEFGLRRGPLAFPWTLLGHTQAEWYPINQLAAVGGVPVLTLLVLIFNVLGLLAIEAMHGSGLARTPLGRRLPVPSRWVGPALVFMATAAFTANSHPHVDASRSLRVGIVQPALPAHSWADIHDVDRIDTLISFADRLPADVELILWPETALPPGRAARNRIQAWIDSTESDLLTGAISTAEGGRVYNSALLFSPGKPVKTYHKRRLVPFAERVPAQDSWPWLRRLAIPSGGIPGYTRGVKNDLMQIRDTRFGVLICFESLFDDVTRSYADRGAELFVILTQDGWWGDSFGFRQHLAFNRLRAIETGRPLIQASVSGVSALIHSNGAVSNNVGWMESAAFAVDVPLAARPTLFMRLGDWITLIAGVLAIGIIVTVALRKL